MSALLAAPVGWLVVAYLGSLVVLFVAAFWRLDPFTAEVIRDYSFSNFQTLWNSRVYRDIALRTIAIAAAVTLIDAVVAFPIAFYMAKVASPRTRGLLVVAILMPLWASYLVKVYAWRIILQRERAAELAARAVRAHGAGLRQRRRRDRLLVPVAAVHDPAAVRGARADPDSLLEASADLGARPAARSAGSILPLAFPALVAGSIFTFSLTLGDYIAPRS